MTGGTPPEAVRTFPFSAVVANDDAKLALLLLAIDPRLGGVLLRGHKGTAKTTLARGLAALLADGARFAELPLGASEDRVTGSIDLAAALADGARRFEPGVLAAADGGVLYVDEVNLLADHLVDIVLDVSVSGRNRVERDGISHEHPARFVLVGSMNPEEGELRPQLLDRFGLMVDVETPIDPQVRIEAVDRRMAFDEDQERFVAGWAGADADLRRRLAGAMPARVEPSLRLSIARLCASFGVEGLRADLVMTRSAAALAGWHGRTVAIEDDVLRVAPMVLAHRRRRGPFDEPGIDQQELDDAWDRALNERDGDRTSPRHDDHSDAPAEDDADEIHGSADDTPADGGGRRGGGGDTPSEHDPSTTASDSGRSGVEPANDANDTNLGEGGGPDTVAPETSPARVAEMGAARVAPLPVTAPRRGEHGGRRATSPSPSSNTDGDRVRGRLVGDRSPDGPVSSVAVHASVTATAAQRGRDPNAAPVLREAVHERRSGRLVVLCVDTSGSMNGAARMEAAKGAALGLLMNVYQRRDKVALVTFGGGGATVALRPTTSVEVARRRLAELPSGGATPLADGLRTAYELITSADPDDPLLVVISDGRASSGPDGHDPVRAAHAVASDIARSGIQSVVVDADTSAVPLGLAGELADHLGGALTPLPTDASELTGVIQRRASPPTTEKIRDRTVL